MILLNIYEYVNLYLLSIHACYEQTNNRKPVILVPSTESGKTTAGEVKEIGCVGKR